MRKGWLEARFGDVARVVKGRKPISTSDDSAMGRPYLTADVLRGATAIQFVPHDALLDCVELVGTETIILWDGAGAGDVFKAQPGVLASTMSRVDSKKVGPGFLYLLLENKKNEIKSSCRGTTVPHVSPEALMSLKLLLPQEKEQKRIVDLVASVDSYIESLQHQVDAARTVRNAVLHDLLSAGGDDWTEEPLSNLLARSIGGVWGVDPGGEQIDVTVVRSTEFMNSGILRFSTGARRSVKASQLATRELKEGDILLEKSGGGPEQPVGRVVFVEADIPPRTVCSNFIQLLSPKKELVLPRFLFLMMWYWHSQKRTLEFQAQTTGIRNLRTSDYLEQRLRLPPVNEQRRIVEIVVAMDDAIAKSEESIQKAKTLRSGLLADLLSGEHEIPESYDRFLGAA
jgi:type I restriction enzyme S subunit